jgi:hypothetical protein
MPHAPVPSIKTTLGLSLVYFKRSYTYTYSSFSHDFLPDFNISITTAATSFAPYRSPRLGNPRVLLHFLPCLHMALSYQTVSKTLT